MQKITDTINLSSGELPSPVYGPDYASFSRETICKAFAVPTNLLGIRVLVSVIRSADESATPATEPSTPSDIGYCRDAEVRRVYLG